MREIIHCKKCLMPSSRPRIVFTDGICNACVYAEEKKLIDWQGRSEEFEALKAQMREASRARGNPYDVVVPFSGGKDSAAILYKLKHEHGLNPLGVTYGQLLWTDVGRRNFHRVCDSGLEILYWRVNQAVSRNLSRRFMIERGHPKLHYDAAVNAVPIITAQKFGIPFVMFAEHGETEYGGKVLDEESRKIRNLTEVLEHQVGDHPLNWMTNGLTERDLYPYIMPEASDVTAYYFSYFFPWDIHENARFAQDRMEFEAAWSWESINAVWRGSTKTKIWGKSDGSFEGYDSIDDKIDDLDYYMMWIKFGFGRATRQASRLIQNGHLTREQGLELVEKYDGEFPQTYLDDVLAYLGMDLDELHETIDTHRNQEIWQKAGNDWSLRHPPR